MNHVQREEILRQMNLSQVYNRLFSYPGQIKVKKDECDNYQRQFDTVELSRKERENEIMLNVSGSNAETRKANLFLDCQNDEEYKDLLAACTTADGRVKQAQNELELLQDEYKSTQIWGKIIAGELGFWAGDDERSEDGQTMKKASGM